MSTIGEKINHFSVEEAEREQCSGFTLQQFNELFEQDPPLVEKIVKVNARILALGLVDDYEAQQYCDGIPTRDSYGASGIIGARIRSFRPYYETSYSERLNGALSERQLAIGREAGEKCITEIFFKAEEWEPTRPSAFMNLVFSTDTETARRYSIYQWKDLPANPAHVSFEGVFIGKQDVFRHTPLDEAIKNGAAELIAVPEAAYHGLADLAKQPENMCIEAIATLQQLGREQGIGAQKIADLAKAIIDYATYVKPEPTSDNECGAEIGRCMTVPSNFKHFCREWVGIDINTDAYASFAGYENNFYHEVNIVDGIVIDWTAKQYPYDRDKPYPLVYKNGGKEVRSTWGPLTGRYLG